MATRLVHPLYQAMDANGDPGNGWKLAFYETGTTTLLNTYSDEALTVANANPVICNCEGRPANGAGDPVSIFGANKEDYKVILLDADDNVIETKDPIDSITYNINSFGTRPAQHWGTTTGTADAFLIKPDPSISVYSDDIFFTQQCHLDNNAGSTLAVFEEGTVADYLTALDMMKYDGAGAKTALEAGDNQAGQTYIYRLDGTDAVCLNPGIPHVDLTNAVNYPSATEILEGVLEIATQVETDAETSDITIVTPLKLASNIANNDRACKAWVEFNGATAAITDSFNVSGVVRNSAGLYIVSFTSNMPDTNYAVVLGGDELGGHCTLWYKAKAVSSFQIENSLTGHFVPEDTDFTSVAIFSTF